MIRPRLLRPGHPDRSLSVEEAAQAGYDVLVHELDALGVSEQEAAVAIESLAQAHLSQLVERRAIEDKIDAARVEKGLQPIYRTGCLSNRLSWGPTAVGAVLWLVILGTSVGMIWILLR